MMLTVRHLWMSISRFVFNCYHQWSSIVLQNRNGTAGFLHSIVVVVQGDPLAMIAYRIVILPLIKNIKREIPDVTQPWYADDARSLGTFEILETYFYSLMRHGPGQRCHPKLTKSVLIVRLENLEAGRVFGAHHGFRVCTDERYIRGYIGDDK